MKSAAVVEPTLPVTQVPFFRPDLRSEEIREVMAVLESGWLTTGPRAHRFEEDFKAAVSADHAIAVSSCTAALHLAVEALGLRSGEGVLVPTMTFAASAEIIRYLGGLPILVDCDPVTGNMDLADAARRLAAASGAGTRVVGIIPVHVGGLMLDVAAVRALARAHGLWIVEDAAHAMPASWRPGPTAPWQSCGGGTADITCFSFYANKTLTTGEGGMAVTNDPALAERMRTMSLHGLSHDAWGRYSGNGKWDYDIVASGFKYNLTDLAAAIGIHQLARAEEMRLRRQEIALEYTDRLAHLDEIELPASDVDRIHAWHLFPVCLRLNRLAIDRNAFFQKLTDAGVSCAVHWKPLHMHPYYRTMYGYVPEDFPNATRLFHRTLSLPLFPGMTPQDIDHVVNAVERVIVEHRR